MATYKCKNFGSCSRADAGEEFSLAAGTDDKCPECSSTLVRTVDGDSGNVNGGVAVNRKSIVIASISVIVLLALAGFSYMKWNSSQVVTLTPDSAFSTSSATASMPVASTPVAPSNLPEAKISERPAPMVANETAARKTCDEATKAKQLDANKICSRATAVTLMNSGVLSAIDGRLDDAEKDYLAARDKDPDFPELYFNIALLKARQNKGSEAVDNLALAEIKGFRQFAAIKSEPALQKLKSDPTFKTKIEAYENK